MNDEKISKKNNLVYKLLLITIFFNIWFPKAGIKISGIPLTVGNVFFAITFVCWILSLRNRQKIKLSPVGLPIITSIFYYLTKYIVVFYKGYEISEVIGYIIPLCIYPLIYFVVYDKVDTSEKLNKSISIIIKGFFFITLYALLQFFVGIENCDVPGLTVNYTDYINNGEMWYMTKSNGTDVSNSKIVSTYQNGNLFGISLILIYPIVYNYYKNKKDNKKLYLSLILFISVLFLTLSRACWLGLVLFIIFEILLKNEKNKKSIMQKFLIIFVSVVAIIMVFIYMPSVANRLFNTSVEDWISASGRTEGLIEVFTSMSKSNTIIGYIIGPYGISNYTGLAYEVLPLSVFVQSGIIGLILLYNIFFKSIKLLKCNNNISKAIRLALIIWIIVGCIECGYWLPPAALNLFMLISIGVKSKELNCLEEEKWIN